MPLCLRVGLFKRKPSAKQGSAKAGNTGLDYLGKVVLH